ncbi:MAG TPA: type II secretion system F family protein [Polyangia bacterium]
MQQVLIGLGALAVVALFEGLVHTIRFFSERRHEELRRRLQSLGGDGEKGGLSLLRQGRVSSIPFWDEFLRGIPLTERLEGLLDQAQVELTVAKLYAFSLLAALSGGLLGVVIGGPIVALLLAALAVVFPTLIVYGIREKRSRKLSEQLPDALDMMARSLRAGHALTSAFKLVASEMPTPVSVEFGRAFEEQNLGVGFERAVVQMTSRAPKNRDLRIFAVSVIVQKETGGNLVEILEKIAETIRARYRFYGRLAALTGEGRVSGIVLGALPFVTGLVLTAINGTYMRGLVATPIGKGFLVYAIVSWIIGVIWLREMAKVEL